MSLNFPQFLSPGIYQTIEQVNKFNALGNLAIAVCNSAPAHKLNSYDFILKLATDQSKFFPLPQQIMQSYYKPSSLIQMMQNVVETKNSYEQFFSSYQKIYSALYKSLAPIYMANSLAAGLATHSTINFPESLFDAQSFGLLARTKFANLIGQDEEITDENYQEVARLLEEDKNVQTAIKSTIDFAVTHGIEGDEKCKDLEMLIAEALPKNMSHVIKCILATIILLTLHFVCNKGLEELFCENNTETIIEKIEKSKEQLNNRIDSLQEEMEVDTL